MESGHCGHVVLRFITCAAALKGIEVFSDVNPVMSDQCGLALYRKTKKIKK